MEVQPTYLGYYRPVLAPGNFTLVDTNVSRGKCIRCHTQSTLKVPKGQCLIGLMVGSLYEGFVREYVSKPLSVKVEKKKATLTTGTSAASREKKRGRVKHKNIAPANKTHGYGDRGN